MKEEKGEVGVLGRGRVRVTRDGWVICLDEKDTV